MIFDRKPAVCLANNGKDTKHNIYTARIIHFVINDKDCNLYKTLWCERGLQLADIRTMNVRESEFNPRLGYNIVRLYN